MIMKIRMHDVKAEKKFKDDPTRGFFTIKNANEEIRGFFEKGLLDLLNYKWVAIRIESNCDIITRNLIMLLDREYLNLVFFVNKNVYDWCNAEKNIKSFNVLGMLTMVGAEVIAEFGLTKEICDKIGLPNYYPHYITDQLIDDIVNDPKIYDYLYEKYFERMRMLMLMEGAVRLANIRQGVH